MAKKKSEKEESSSAESGSESGSNPDDSQSSNSDSSAAASDSSGSYQPRVSTKAASSTKKISQLALAIGKDVPNPKGKKKEMHRLRKWLGQTNQNTLLTLDDLPEGKFADILIRA